MAAGDAARNVQGQATMDGLRCEIWDITTDGGGTTTLITKFSKVLHVTATFNADIGATASNFQWSASGGTVSITLSVDVDYAATVMVFGI